MQRHSMFHSHWIFHSPSLLDRTIFFGMRTGSFWRSEVRVSLITFLSRQPRFCLSRWSGGHRFPVSLVTQAHLTALLFLNGHSLWADLPSGQTGPTAAELARRLGRHLLCSVCWCFFPRVRTPCGHGAQVIVEGREEQSDGGEKNKETQHHTKPTNTTTRGPQAVSPPSCSLSSVQGETCETKKSV